MRLLMLISLVLVTPLAFSAQGQQVAQKQTHQIVQAAQLKGWYDNSTPMTVVDARTQAYFDGNVLPGAKWIPSDSSDEAIQAALPSKGSLIVVYCYSTTCPASGWLFDKLISLGYKNVYEYSGGIYEWNQLGYPTHTLQQ